MRYTIFLYLVLLIAYAQRDQNIFWQNKALLDILVNTEKYEEVCTSLSRDYLHILACYSNYLKNTMVFTLELQDRFQTCKY